MKSDRILLAAAALVAVAVALAAIYVPVASAILVATGHLPPPIWKW